MKIESFCAVNKVESNLVVLNQRPKFLQRRWSALHLCDWWTVKFDCIHKPKLSLLTGIAIRFKSSVSKWILVWLLMKLVLINDKKTEMMHTT